MGTEPSKAFSKFHELSMLSIWEGVGTFRTKPYNG